MVEGLGKYHDHIIESDKKKLGLKKAISISIYNFINVGSDFVFTLILISQGRKLLNANYRLLVYSLIVNYNINSIY